MRPVDRGPVPVLTNGSPKTVADYKDWRYDLILRLGKYCCYCNMPLHDSPQVEHVVPKSLIPALKVSWHNMLLACGPCNRAKDDTICPPVTHFLPDYHNSHLAFTHRFVTHPILGRRACILRVRKGLSPLAAWKAQSTLTLCKLDVIETDAEKIARASDLRWLHRHEVWLKADRYRRRWNIIPPGTDITEHIEALADLVSACGFFSVWFDVFSYVPAVKQALVQAFPNTAACFPAPTYDPVPRIPGDL